VPKEGDNVTASRDPGRVTAILYSQLATSLTSLAIILLSRALLSETTSESEHHLWHLW
jgi:hypothetical protein